MYGSREGQFLRFRSAELCGFRSETTSAAKRGVYSPYACRDFAAELQCGAHLRSEARNLQAGPYACLQCWTSPRSSPPQRSEKSTADVYSTGFRRGASLWSSPPQRSEREELGYSAEFHCGAVAAKRKN